MKVTLLTNLVPPYRTDAYDALHRRAVSAGGGLRVICTHPSEPQRNWPSTTGTFPRTLLPGFQVPLGENRTLSIPFGVIRALQNAPPSVLILAGFGIAQWQAQTWARQHRVPTILQFDGWAGSDDAYTNPLRHKIRQHMIARANGFIAASARGAAWFEQHGVPSQKVVIAPIPASFSTPDTPDVAGARDRRYDLLWSGRTTRSKGFDRFIEIADQLFKQGLVNRIAIVGCTDIPNTTRLLARTGLSEHTNVFAQLPPDQLPAILMNVKLCLFPSRNDAYGVGVIEAITCGSVALASSMVGCAPDVLENSEILPVDNCAAWIAACTRLLSDLDHREQTRRRQAGKITRNTATYHGDAMWNAIERTTFEASENRRWN